MSDRRVRLRHVGLWYRPLLCGKFALQSRYLQLQPSRTIGIVAGLILWPIRHGMVHQRIPLILRLSQVNRRLAIEGKAQEGQA